MKFRLMIVAALCLLTASPAWAQFETASVVGTVRDSSGAVVPGAAVTLTGDRNRRVLVAHDERQRPV